MAIPILMPALSPTMTEGTLAKWLKKEGDSVSPGQVLAEVETDKAIMEVESIDSGKIAKILVPETSSSIKVNSLIAIIAEEGDDPDSIQKILERYESKDSSVSNNIESASDNEIKGNDSTFTSKNRQIQNSEIAKNSDGKRVFISPLAKRIAEQSNIQFKDILGTGPNGRIVKADIINTIQNSKFSPKQSLASKGRSQEEFSKIPISGTRKVIAKRLLQSKQSIPHFYISISCCVDSLLDIRKQINNTASGDFKVSVNDLIIKATAKALSQHEQINSSWAEDSILQYNNVDISVAVSTDFGLITPIIRNADMKSITEISSEMKELAQKARANKLRPEEFQGGSLSISNLGMYGVDKFHAIINPPQSCIVAVGASVEHPIVKEGQIKIATLMELTLSCDHRVIDGDVAAKFAKTIKQYIENPVLMMI